MCRTSRNNAVCFESLEEALAKDPETYGHLDLVAGGFPCQDLSIPLTKDGIWQSSFKKWPKAATGGLTEYLTADTSESPKTAVECSLSEVLETDVPERYYLSRKAVEGIIRRSWREGRNAYVLLHDPEKETTQRLKRLSLRQLAQLTNIEPTPEQQEIILLAKQSDVKQAKQVQEDLMMGSLPHTLGHKKAEKGHKGISEKSQTQLRLGKGVLRDDRGREITLRKLTPTEKEKLQGLPKHWTLVEDC